MSMIILPNDKPGMHMVTDGAGGFVLTFRAPGTPFDGQEVALPRAAAWRFVLMGLFLVRCPEALIKLLEEHAPAEARGTRPDGAQG